MDYSAKAIYIYYFNTYCLSNYLNTYYFRIIVLVSTYSKRVDAINTYNYYYFNTLASMVINNLSNYLYYYCFRQVVPC